MHSRHTVRGQRLVRAATLAACLLPLCALPVLSQPGMPLHAVALSLFGRQEVTVETIVAARATLKTRLDEEVAAAKVLTDTYNATTWKAVAKSLQAEQTKFQATLDAKNARLGRVATFKELVQSGVGTEDDKTDPAKMRPGMRFQGTIELARVKNAVLIPREAVSVASEGPYVYRRGAFDVDIVPVKLGRENDKFVEVLSGINPGDRVLVAKTGDEEKKS